MLVFRKEFESTDGKMLYGTSVSQILSLTEHPIAQKFKQVVRTDEQHFLDFLQGFVSSTEHQSMAMS